VKIAFFDASAALIERCHQSGAVVLTLLGHSNRSGVLTRAVLA
jgi:hypothetical protein